MFSSGPTTKYQEWSLAQLEFNKYGRSHVSQVWIGQICSLYEQIKTALNIPSDYKIAFVNGSATGAMDCLFWNILGSRPVNVLANDLFSKRWADEIFQTLKVPGQSINNFDAQINHDYDFVFNMVATTSGTKWFDKNALQSIQGLVFCDATSAVFCENIDWSVLDCTGFSFQKALGGEAGIGCIVLSPKALDKIKNKGDLFPVPRFLKITDNIFLGKLNNTPSLIALEDIALNLNIFMKNGGLESAIKQCAVNKSDIMECVSPILKVTNTNNSANAITCLVHSKWTSETNQEKWDMINKVAKKAEAFEIFDIVGHPADEPCWRFWSGPTIQNCKSYINKFMSIVKDDI